MASLVAYDTEESSDEERQHQHEHQHNLDSNLELEKVKLKETTKFNQIENQNDDQNVQSESKFSFKSESKSESRSGSGLSQPSDTSFKKSSLETQSEEEFLHLKTDSKMFKNLLSTTQLSLAPPVATKVST